MHNSENIIEEATELLKECSSHYAVLSKHIEKLGISLGSNDEYILVSRFMVLDSYILAKDIIGSLQAGSLLLPLIGLRSLVETLINIAYVFHHPKHIDDQEWIRTNISDYVSRANNLKAWKNQLNNEVIINRAKEVGLGEHYIKIFIPLCNFTHMLGFSPTQTPDKKDFMYRAAFVQTFEVVIDIYTIVSKHFRFEVSVEFHNKVSEFCKKYDTNL